MRVMSNDTFCVARQTRRGGSYAGLKDRVSLLCADGNFLAVHLRLRAYMNRAAIIATIVASMLSFPSLSLAASDAEIGGSGDKMSGAFRCSTYAQLFHDQKEQQRLFQIGLKAGRDYVEGAKEPG
jgi:hypothetical protein